jgi:hypothetical protein
MRLPVIQGVIRRRILVNFRVDPDVMKAQLPSRFTPKLQGNHAIAGVCLIRLEAIRPPLLPAFAGISSENAAHRVAVLLETDTGEKKEGVFIPRRDTGSLMNHLAGGRVFPGEHHRAMFNVREDVKTSISGCNRLMGLSRFRFQVTSALAFQSRPVSLLWKQHLDFSNLVHSDIR